MEEECERLIRVPQRHRQHGVCKVRARVRSGCSRAVNVCVCAERADAEATTDDETGEGGIEGGGEGTQVAH